jgi:tRNA-binding protein
MCAPTEPASWADFERIGLRAGIITALYSAEPLLGRQVICATGLGTKRVAGFKSEVLVTGITRDDGAVVLAALERP